MTSTIVFIGGTIASTFIYFATKSEIENLIVWLITIISCYTIAFVYWNYSKIKSNKDPATIITTYWFLIACCDLNWSYITMFHLPKLNLDSVALICVFVCGISSTIMLLYLPARRMTNSLILCTTVPFSLGILNSPFSFSWYLAGLTVIYTTTIIICANTVQKIYISEFKEKEKNLSLVEEIQSKTIDVIANAKSTMLVDIASGMAHEINNPLTTVAIHLEILEHKFKSLDIEKTGLNKSIASIKKSVSRISEITGNLSYFFSSSSNEIHFQKEDLNALIKDVYVYFYRKTGGQIAQLAIEGPSEKILLTCNKKELTHALKHLINNSIEAFETNDTIRNQVQISYRLDKETIYICIKDNGKGIPKHITDQIMHPFFTTKEVGKGLGLGLSIANSIIRNHNGSLKLNIENQKTVFTIQLPNKERHNDQPSIS